MLIYGYARREIICAFDIYEKVSRAFPSRRVTPEARAAAGCFYYWNMRGEIRLVDIRRREIYVPEEFPFVRRIRPRQK